MNPASQHTGKTFVRHALGVQRQRELCRDLAKRKGLEVVAEFSDNDASASTRSTAVRPHYADMLNRARVGEFTTILAYSNSRLTRRPREFDDLIVLHEEHAVKISTVASGEFDLNLASGRALARTVAAWDAAEAEQASERVKAAVDQRSAQGRWHGGAIPYGYRVKDKGLVPEPPEVGVIMEAARRLLAGDTMYSITSDWNRYGLTTRGGKHWRQGNIRAILMNRSLLGETKAGVKGWDSVINQRTFDRLNRIFTDPSRKVTHSPDVRGGKYSMGGGLTVCGTCGKRLITGSHHGRTGLKCTKVVNGPDACGRIVIDHAYLEKYVFETVIAALKENPRWNQRLAEPDPDNDGKITKLEVIRDDLSEQKRRADDAFIRGLIAERDYTTHSVRIKAELAEIEKRVSGLLGTTILTDAMADGLAWESWTPMRRRNFLSIAIRRVEIDPYPKGIAKGVARRLTETDEQYDARHTAHVHSVMEQRVRIVV